MLLSIPIPLNKNPKIKSTYSQSPINLCVKSMSTTPESLKRREPMSAFESRVSLVFALANQAATLSQRLFMELATETAKYVFPSGRFESRSFEEALMSVPNLETVEFKVLSRNNKYEIREVESYFIAETTMPGKYGFEFAGASQSFNVLAEYLFGKNTGDKQMEMTTPVFTRKMEPKGEKMDMTTPVITTRVKDQDKWTMSFVMPSKYGANLPLPKNSSVTIREVPKKIIAVVAFSGHQKGRGSDVQIFLGKAFNAQIFNKATNGTERQLNVLV